MAFSASRVPIVPLEAHWAARRHAHLLKRSGKRGKAADIWSRLWAEGDRDAGLELAMYFEHHARDLPSAVPVDAAPVEEKIEETRLPLELKELFEEWLEAHFPERKERVLNQLRAARGGRIYEARWGERMRGKGVEAELLARRFDLAAKRLGLNHQREDWSLDSSQFLRPQPKSAQLTLF